MLILACLTTPLALASPVEQSLFVDAFTDDTVASGDWRFFSTAGGYRIRDGTLDLWTLPGGNNAGIRLPYADAAGCRTVGVTAMALTAYRYHLALNDGGAQVTIELNNDGLRLAYHDLSGTWRMVDMNPVAAPLVPYDLQLTLLPGGLAVAMAQVGGVPVAAAVATDVMASPRTVEAAELAVWTDAPWDAPSYYRSTGFVSHSSRDPAACGP